MTFYEAALRVLEAAGRPMHIQEITEQSIAQNMLSHVGKAPDKTMLSRLAAMARRTRDRRGVGSPKENLARAAWKDPPNPPAPAQTRPPPFDTLENPPPLLSRPAHPP